MTYILLLTAAAALLCLWLERVRLDRSRGAVSLVIAVTGTRGKSTVTSMLAAALRAGGRRVISKTTGSESLMTLPDGSVREVKRRGHPSILEQKQVIQLAARLRVDVAVVEVMSIHRENHFVESHKIIRPDIVLVTNFRVDHTAAAGSTREDVASVIGLDVPRGARVFVPRQESLPEFQAVVAEAGGELVEVPPQGSGGAQDALGPGQLEFADNRDLVYAAGTALHLDDAAIREGFLHARADVGSLRAWRYRPIGSHGECVLVNAFAANDPESTLLIHDRIMRSGLAGEGGCVGVLNLRGDRGDRTVQWAEVLGMGELARFSHLYLCGIHAAALERRLSSNRGGTRLDVLRTKRAAEITQALSSEIAGTGGVVFGFGNIAGVARELIAHWSEVAEPMEI